jgi:SprT protein
MMQPAFKETLARYVPVEALDEVTNLVKQHQIRLKVRRGRLSKLGDFRPSRNGNPHQITLNGTLNVFAFLLVFLHEFAHLIVWEKHGRAVAPHGKAWKDTFGYLLREAAAKGYFHPSLKDEIIEYSFKIKAAGLASPELQRQLRLFDKEPVIENEKVFLEDIPENSLFFAANGRVFRKEDKLRKRYRCLCMRNKRTYLFNPMAEVTPAQEGKKEN